MALEGVVLESIMHTFRAATRAETKRCVMVVVSMLLAYSCSGPEALNVSERRAVMMPSAALHCFENVAHSPFAFIEAGGEGLYAADPGNNRVYMFTEHRLVQEVGNTGQGPGEFSELASIRVKNDFLVGLDIGAFNLQLFDLDANFLNRINIGFGVSQHFDFDDDMNFYLNVPAPEVDHPIVKVDANGQFLRTFGEKHPGVSGSALYFDNVRHIHCVGPFIISIAETEGLIEKFNNAGERLASFDLKKEPSFRQLVRERKGYFESHPKRRSDTVIEMINHSKVVGNLLLINFADGIHDPPDNILALKVEDTISVVKCFKLRLSPREPFYAHSFVAQNQKLYAFEKIQHRLFKFELNPLY